MIGAYPSETNIVDKCRKTSCCETKSYYNLSKNIIIFITMSCSKCVILIHAGALIRTSDTDKRHIGVFQHLTIMWSWFFGLCREFPSIAPRVFLTRVFLTFSLWPNHCCRKMDRNNIMSALTILKRHNNGFEDCNFVVILHVELHMQSYFERYDWD